MKIYTDGLENKQMHDFKNFSKSGIGKNGKWF